MIIPWLTTLPWVHCINFQTKECYHSARFEKGTRYYVIRLEPDLLGDWTLYVSNGRIKSRLGQCRIIAFEGFADAYEHFCLMAKERYQRGYYPVSYYTEDILYQIMLLWAFVKEQIRPLQKKNGITSNKRAPRLVTDKQTTLSQLHDSQQMSFIF
ncbi:WGR domain-containing protein [Fluoribacter gormanii]|uniref:WGR domain-containing protein n=1 Tax=Fluoribacter gormanii TaxID=464 RepID=UPI001F5EE7CE|nr:WGR domain-containing protein [Fluoribacter gormanii]